VSGGRARRSFLLEGLARPNRHTDESHVPDRGAASEGPPLVKLNYYAAAGRHRSANRSLHWPAGGGCSGGNPARSTACLMSARKPHDSDGWGRHDGLSVRLGAYGRCSALFKNNPSATARVTTEYAAKNGPSCRGDYRDILAVDHRLCPKQPAGGVRCPRTTIGAAQGRVVGLSPG